MALKMQTVAREMVDRYRRLCAPYGCHTARELTSWLATEGSLSPSWSKTWRCLIACFLRVCGQVGVGQYGTACAAGGVLQPRQLIILDASAGIGSLFGCSPRP